MTDAKLLKQVSKQMAYLLRHAPEQAGLQLDPEGYVSLDALVDALRQTVPEVTPDTVKAVVALVEPRKQRYAIQGDAVRANYGHSLADRIALTPEEPPVELFHGTARGALGEIRERGLLPMRRQYVHLTTDRQLAISVGGRHGAACLLEVDAKRAYAEGIVFYKANFTFWLADAVPSRFIRWP
jgi:putative RNA 2'-phosphotransferase